MIYLRRGIRIRTVLLAVCAVVIASAWWFYSRILTPQIPLATPGSMSTANSHYRILGEDDIAEVVFRHQFKECFRDKQRDVYFLAREAKKEPSDKFMKRFEKDIPSVKKLSQATRHSEGITDKDSGRRGILLRVGDIHWVNDSTVEVIGSCYADTENLLEYVYEVTREGNQWVLKNSTLTLIT